MKNISSFETDLAVQTIDQFLGEVATTSRIRNYDEYQGLVRREFSPLPEALSTLIKAHGTYIDYHPCNRVTEFTRKQKQNTFTARINHIGHESGSELITIANRDKGITVLGAKKLQYISLDKALNGSFDVASSDKRFGEHFFFMPSGSDDSERLTKFVEISAPLIQKFVTLVRLKIVTVAK